MSRARYARQRAELASELASPRRDAWVARAGALGPEERFRLDEERVEGVPEPARRAFAAHAHRIAWWRAAMRPSGRGSLAALTVSEDGRLWVIAVSDADLSDTEALVAAATPLRNRSSLWRMAGTIIVVEGLHETDWKEGLRAAERTIDLDEDLLLAHLGGAEAARVVGAHDVLAEGFHHARAKYDQTLANTENLKRALSSGSKVADEYARLALAHFTQGVQREANDALQAAYFRAMDPSAREIMDLDKEAVRADIAEAEAAFDADRLPGRSRGVVSLSLYERAQTQAKRERVDAEGFHDLIGRMALADRPEASTVTPTEEPVGAPPPPVLPPPAGSDLVHPGADHRTRTATPEQLTALMRTVTDTSRIDDPTTAALLLHEMGRINEASRARLGKDLLPTGTGGERLLHVLLAHVGSVRAQDPSWEVPTDGREIIALVRAATARPS